MGTLAAGALDRLALFAVYVAFATFNIATVSIAEAFGIGGFAKTFTAIALLGAPLSLHKRTFGLALILLNALVMAEALLYLFALNGALGVRATRAPAFWLHL